MTDQKRKKALQLFEQPVDEDLSPKRNKSFHTTMAQDGLDNLNINIDYQNYDIIASGGDIIITPDDGGDDIIIHPSHLKADYVSYTEGSGSTITVQNALDDLNDDLKEEIDRATNAQQALSDRIDQIVQSQKTVNYNILTHKPSINGVIIMGDMNGEDYYLVNGVPSAVNKEKPVGGALDNNDLNRILV